MVVFALFQYWFWFTMQKCVSFKLLVEKTAQYSVNAHSLLQVIFLTLFWKVIGSQIIYRGCPKSMPEKTCQTYLKLDLDGYFLPYAYRKNWTVNYVKLFVRWWEFPCTVLWHSFIFVPDFKSNITFRGWICKSKISLCPYEITRIWCNSAWWIYTS